MVNVIPLMTAERNPHFVWRLFSTQKEAQDHENQLTSIEISQFIAMDPMEVKAARYVLSDHLMLYILDIFLSMIILYSVIRR